MGKVFGTCCCELTDEEWYKGWWWKESVLDEDGYHDALCAGSLCDKCAPAYRAVIAETYEEAKELLEKVESVDLIDIMAGKYNKPIETIDVCGIPFREVEL